MDGLWISSRASAAALSPGRSRIRLIGLAIVIAAHLALLRMFPPLAADAAPEIARDIEASIVSPAVPRPAIPQPVLLKPDADVVPEPEIAIDEPAAPAAVTAVARVVMSQVIPPRPDPSHTNPSLLLPAAFAKPGRTSALVMVLVNVEGSITDARIVTSSGDVSLDEMALAYVKAQWRLLPASFSGRAVARWTTVLVPFRTG